jgi:hypothetical protein
MLRVLQERSFERVGGEEKVKVNVRVVCATNHNLEQAVKSGKFRLDLFYRINLFVIETPPCETERRILPSWHGTSLRPQLAWASTLPRRLPKQLSRLCVLTTGLETSGSYRMRSSVLSRSAQKVKFSHGIYRRP